MPDIHARDLPSTLTPAVAEAAMERAQALRCEATRALCVRGGRRLGVGLHALRASARRGMRASAGRLEVAGVAGFAPNRTRAAPGWRAPVARCDAS